MSSADSKGTAFADVRSWAEEQFGGCELNDTRRTRRLVDYAARQAAQPEASINSLCEGDEAVAEGTYRWLRNSAIRPEAVDAGPFRLTAKTCSGREVVLAIQDTTTLVFQHSVADKLGSVGGPKGHEVSGLLVHSTLLVDPCTGELLGLIDQQRWGRPPTPAGIEKETRRGTGQHKKVAYQDKESIKWEQATTAMCARLNDTSNIITVCDREADVYEYLTHLIGENQRFVVRACQDRYLSESTSTLRNAISRQPVFGTRQVKIEQRGAQRAKGKQQKRAARPARVATMSIRVKELEIARPKDRRTGPESLNMNVVYLRERNSPTGEEPAEWILLTSEPIRIRKQIERIIEYYERRWLIEEFHQAWKSGCRIETRRLQAIENLERIMAVSSHIAVRLLQLRALSQAEPDRPCTLVLSGAQWQSLFAKMESKRPMPRQPPTIAWAYSALAKLAGWRDTKRTGRVGWQTLWRGWARLELLAEGWNLAQEAAAI